MGILLTPCSRLCVNQPDIKGRNQKVQQLIFVRSCDLSQRLGEGCDKAGKHAANQHLPETPTSV